jgi:hypothetical protein
MEDATTVYNIWGEMLFPSTILAMMPSILRSSDQATMFLMTDVLIVYSTKCKFRSVWFITLDFIYSLCNAFTLVTKHELLFSVFCLCNEIFRMARIFDDCWLWAVHTRCGLPRFLLGRYETS